MNYIFSLVKKHKKALYAIATLIALLTVFFETYRLYTNNTSKNILTSLDKNILKGEFATIILAVVMFIGALDRRWALTKNLLRIRGELAIIGSLLLIPHCYVYTIKFIVKCYQNVAFSPMYLFLNLFGIGAFIVMIPLLITSFIKIRAKMSSMRWKKIQKWSYLFYILTYIHILLVLIGKREIETFKVILITVVFILYLILRLSKYFNNTKSVS